MTLGLHYEISPLFLNEKYTIYMTYEYQYVGFVKHFPTSRNVWETTVSKKSHAQ